MARRFQRQYRQGINELKILKMIKTGLYKVLAADDATIRLLIQTALEKVGFRVTLSRNGEDAIYLFDEFSHDLVLLDVDMPIMDGYKTCSHLCKQKG